MRISNDITKRMSQNLSQASLASEGIRWQPSAHWSRSSVETLTLRSGFQLVLSRIDGGSCAFHYAEPDDVFGIGFHLRGGARFDMEGNTFETKPLEAWAGAAPRGSMSTFSLPSHGFHTVSLRFAPSAVRELLDQNGYERGGFLDEMARMADSKVSTARLCHLDPATAQLISAIFTTPYTGAARRLFLESCALGLLASQIDAVTRQINPPRDLADDRLMQEARACLDVHLDAPPSIRELARIIGINDFKLKRSFKARFGTTIFGYVRQRRMERAAAHLHDGLSVSAAAQAVGYACPRCFADAFRRHFGVLPSELTRSAMTDTPAHHS